MRIRSGVVVEQRQDFAAGATKTAIDVSREAEVPRELQEAHVSKFAGDECFGVVNRGSIGDDHLERLIALGLERVEAFCQEVSAVPVWNDDRNAKTSQFGPGRNESRDLYLRDVDCTV